MCLRGVHSVISFKEESNKTDMGVFIRARLTYKDKVDKERGRARERESKREGAQERGRAREEASTREREQERGRARERESKREGEQESGSARESVSKREGEQERV